MALNHVFLALLAVLGAAGGLAGVRLGWAYGQTDPAGGQSWAPHMQLELGWYNYTVTIASDYAPHLSVESTAARALGSVTAVSLLLGGLVALHLLIATSYEIATKGKTLPWGLGLQPRQRHRNCGLTAIFVVPLAIALYMVLLFGTHSKLKDQFGDKANLWPRPDWAFGAAVVSGACLFGIAYPAMKAGPADDGYLPI